MSVLPTFEAASAATFGTLAFFLVTTLLIGRMDMCKKFDADKYMSARNTQSSISLVMSFFASGAGAWMLFTVPEAAILGGPIAVLGYAFACVLPLIIFACVAPSLRRSLPYGITFFEFVQARYGTAVNVYVTLVAAFYMFLYLAAEFSSVGSCVATLSQPPTDSSIPANIPPILGTSIITLLYTTLGGLPVSLITDRVQGVGLLITCTLLLIAAFGYCLFPTYTDLETANAAAANWRTVSTYGVSGGAGDSFGMAVVLILAVTSANLMHTGFQQRIWAARDNAAVLNGLWGAALLTLPFTLIFGLLGMLAYAQFGPLALLGNGADAPYLAFLSAFFLIHTMPTGWQVFAIILAVTMVASSADTLQTGMAGLFSPAIDRLLCRKAGDGKQLAAMGVNLLLTVAINILAIVLATQNISVLSLFVLADLLCATCAVPVIMGLSEKVHPVAALVGCLAGLLTALVIYGVGWGDEPGSFELLLAAGGLYAKTALAAFIATPIVSGLVTALVALPFHIKGYRFAGYADATPAADAKPNAETTIEVESARA